MLSKNLGLNSESSNSDICLSEINGSGEWYDSIPKASRCYSRWSPVEEGVTLAWSDLSVFSKTRNDKNQSYKRIINTVTGAIKAGSLVALMGASGTGKSTLMSALAYRTPPGTEVTGSILINGRPIGSYMKYLSGYVYQEDLFIGSLTVEEHLKFMSKLKFDRRLSHEEVSLKISKILRALGLLKKKDTRIGGHGTVKCLSGGEKKRLALATELLTDPPILFCDEATTGLDSYSAQKIVKLMNLMASNGKTILCTIHQPSSDIFALFSQIILLAEGRIAYMGSTSGALDFFDSLGYRCPELYNPSEYFIKTLAVAPGFESESKLTIRRVCDNFAVSDYAKQVDVVVQYEFHMGRAEVPKTFHLRSNFKEIFWITKLYCLIHRYFLEVIRNPALQWLRILQKMAISLMIGLCYFSTQPYTQKGVQSVQGALFMIVTENTFNPMYSVLGHFSEHHALFMREYKSGLYSPIHYYLCRILALLPGLIIEPTIFVLIMYWLAGLRSSLYAFSMTTFVAILVMNVATSCGILFSNAFDSVPLGLSILVPFDYILMITSGLFIKLSTLPKLIAWTRYFSWLMYSTESLSILQWQGITNITCEETNSDIPCLTNGNEVLEKYSFQAENLNQDLGMMIILCVVFYVMGFICLLKKIKRN